MTEEQKKKILKKGYHVLEMATKFADELEKWSTVLEIHADLEAETKDMPEFQKLADLMEIQSKRIGM